MIRDRASRAPCCGPLADRGAIYFDRVRDAFERAARAVASVREHSIAIGGRSLTLSFAGEALPGRIWPAPAHLRSAPSQSCDLRIMLWDSVSTGVALPEPPWGGGDHVARGDVIGFNNERIRTAFVRDPDLLSLYDAEKGMAIFWTRDAAELPYWESGSPLKAILSWRASDLGWRFVHAAAVGRPDGGVLIVGKGGTGKSTTAISCLSSSLRYCGDDYVLVQAEPKPHVHSLYNSGKLEAHHASSLPHIMSAITNRDRLDSEKALVFIQNCFPARLIAGFPLRAILVPNIADVATTRLHVTTPAAALLALAPSTVFQLPGAGRDAFDFLSRLVKQVPCLKIDLGRDLAQIPAVIDDFLSRF